MTTILATAMNIYIRNMVRIENPPKALENFSKSCLTFENPLYNEAKFFGRYTRGISRNIKLYEEKQTETDKHLLVPRGFLTKLLNECVRLDITFNIKDETSKPDRCLDFGSIISLRDYQKKFVEDIMRTEYGSIAIAPPGSGKTICALEVAYKLGMRTLWLTHTSDLIRQTTERAKEFLPKARLGCIGSGKWEEGDITIALVQTLIRRNIADIETKYPLVIIDECHHTPSSTFTEIITRMSAQKIIGLSATPYRKDKLEEIMFNVVGPTIAKVEKKQLIEAKQIIPATVIQRHTGIAIDGRISDYQTIMDKLCKSEQRLDMIVGDVLVEATTGNICVVLTRTIDYGRKISSRIKNFGFKPSFVYSTEIIREDGKKKRTKAMPKAARNKNIQDFISGETNIIIATLRFLAEGFDHKPLNRLFIVNPISHRNRTLIEQACGRVERVHPGKSEAIVYDYVDDHALLKAQAISRVDIYKNSLMSVIESDMKTDYLL